jgi:hypothetical protein
MKVAKTISSEPGMFARDYKLRLAFSGQSQLAGGLNPLLSNPPRERELVKRLSRAPQIIRLGLPPFDAPEGYSLVL